MKKILVIDDNDDFCRNIKMGLEKTGDYEVFTCNDAYTSIGQVNKINPDLILLDVVMPTLTGQEIAEQIKGNENTKYIPIIFTTGIITQEEAETGQKLFPGGDDFIAKPFRFNQLTDLLAKWLD